MTVRTLRIITTCLCLAASTTVASAQVAPRAALSLADSVQQSLDQARLVSLAREQVNSQQGGLRQARGAFDALLQIAPRFEHREDNIENTGFFIPERLKRGFAQGLHEAFGNLAASLGEQVRQGRADLPLCPADGSYSQYVVTFGDAALPTPLCRPATQALSVQSSDNIADGEDDNRFLYRRPLSFDALSSFSLQGMLASAYRVQVSAASVEAQERGSELLRSLEAAARIVEVSTGVTAERLGALPDFVYANTASIFGQYTKPFRNGSAVQFTGTLDGRGTFFRGKPIDPAFGGTSTPNAFSNRLEMSWVEPLKRGRGAETVQAAERAAEKNVEASRFSFQQTAADQALATADAYFELLAAQESLVLLRESLDTERAMLDGTTRLLAAGLAAEGDVARARARTAEVESGVESGRLAVVSAQATLADAMGIPAAEVMTLVASDAFAISPLDLDVDALAKEALTRRSDVKALSAFRDTSHILLVAAKADTRSRFDIRVSAGVAQAYYGPVFRSLADEYDSRPDNGSYIKYYNPVGFGRAFQQRWQPVGSVTATFELPLRNNQRLGRLAQASASARESDIRATDLDRTIGNTLPRLVEDLRRLRLEWEQRQEAVIQYGTVWDDTLRLRTAGQVSLLSALVTEQQLTQARLQLVQIKRQYASAIARFKRETGTLLEFTEWSRSQLNLGGIVVSR